MDTFKVIYMDNYADERQAIIIRMNNDGYDLIAVDMGYHYFKLRDKTPKDSGV
jgi:hypothetical protein